MKQTLLTLASLLFCAISFAQSVPQGINYQALARDVAGAEIANDTLTVQFSVIEQGDSLALTQDIISWQETHTVITNDFGLFTAVIGQGTNTTVDSSATFDAIDWGSATYSLQLKIDFGSGVFIDMGTTQFMSVPYSLYAKTAANVSATDELQSLTISGDTLFLSGNANNFVVLPLQNLLGCTDSAYCNYQILASTNDGTCSGIAGCIDHLAINFNASATCDDGSCDYLGCTDSLACNYDVSANTDDGLCDLPNGCGDSLYLEYNDSVTCTNSSSCATLIMIGCMDSLACNYSTLTNTSDGSCTYAVSNADCSGYCLTGYILVNGACVAIINGCTDSTAFNFDPLANTDDASCEAVVNGCTDSLACDYDALANTDDSSCIMPDGCTDSLACNYNPLATCDDGSCNGFGCIDSLADNYNSLAACDDGSCDYGYTNVPDYNFETYLELNQMGDGLMNDLVPTASIMNITSLNIYQKGISDLTGIEDFYSLQTLDCRLNPLDSLDVSTNTALSELFCGGNQLTSLDVSQNTALTSLVCNANQLTSLDVSNNTALTKLWCYSNQITSLDVSQNTALELLGCSGNQLTSLDIRNGNNINFSVFNSINNPNLFCIDVDDPTWSDANWTNIDSWANFSTNCATAIGCTDSTAINYNPLANIDDGSCIINGCTDLTASNYDPLANTNDGSCIINGCMDISACNYDSTVTVQDSVSVQIGGGSMGPGSPTYEMQSTCTYATVGYDCAGNCLIGSHVFYTQMPGASFSPASLNSMNAVGGNSWTIADCGGAILASGGPYGYPNYLPFDNLCVALPANYVVNHSNQNSSGWGFQSGSITVDGVSYTYSANIQADPNDPLYPVITESFVVGTCCISGCMDPLYAEYNPLASCDDNTCVTACVNGCMDNTFVEYNALATCDDASCLTACVNGCMDSTYVEYNVLATCDDSSCVTLIVNGCTNSTVTLTLTDSYGDSWNGNTLNVDGIDYTVNTSQNGGNWADYTICIDLLACNNITYTGAPGNSWEYENTWSITNNGVVVYSGGPGTDPGFSETFGFSCPVLGCIDPLANNFDALANTDDGSCTYEVLGCTDNNFTEYNASANTDDGSCTTFQPQSLAALQTAVDLWISDNTLALSTYGQINSNWDVSLITSMEELFKDKSSFNDDISNWDVSNVTDMSFMFYHAEAFNQDISSWNVSNVTDMTLLFQYALAFNQDISSWDVSSVTIMLNMFYHADAFNQDISSWNVSSVTNMNDMFGYTALSDVNKCAIHTGFSFNSNWYYSWWGSLCVPE